MAEARDHLFASRTDEHRGTVTLFLLSELDFVQNQPAMQDALFADRTHRCRGVAAK